jgi:hypothetical protein
MIENLKDKYSKRAFITILLLILIILVYGLWFIINNQSTFSASTYTFLQSLIVSLITTLIASAGMGIFYIFLIPKEQERHQIEEIDPQTTIEYFDRALQSTSFWFYQGHIGRWMRNSAIPKLADKAREKGEIIKVVLILIDPANTDLCKIFSAYCNTIRSREIKVREINTVKAEIFTTIVKATKYNQSRNHSSVQIQLFLSQSFSGLRRDISENNIFLTRVDPRAPALLVKRDIITRPIETLFTAMKTDFEYAKRQCRELNLDECTLVISETPDVQEIKNILASLGFFDIEDTLLNDIQVLMGSDYHPYN